MPITANPPIIMKTTCGRRSFHRSCADAGMFQPARWRVFLRFVPAPVRLRWPSAGFWLCALIAAFTAPSTFALNPAEKPVDYVVTRWNAEEGLPHNSIRKIFQTRDGYLWIATTQGLARFDGLAFTNFSAPSTRSFPNNRITSLAETPDGSLWIGTSAGLARYQNGRFTAYGQADGIKAVTVNAICVAPDGSLWIGGRDGITRWVDGRFVNDIDTSAYDTLGLRAIYVDRQKSIWLACGSEALRYRDGKFTRFGRTEGLPTQRLETLREDADGRVIAVTQSGVFRLDGDRFVPFEQLGALSSQQVSTALVDRDGNLWIGSVGGLDRYSDGKLAVYVDAYGNKLAGVDALFEDREGCLWVGTAAGLARFTDRRGYTLGKVEGILGSLGMAVLQSRDGSIWASSWAGGVARFKDGTVRQYALGAPLSHESVNAIYEAPDGTMWFGNRGSSLDRLEGDKVTTFVYQSGVLTSRPVTAIHADPDGEFLVGIASRGLLQLRDGQLTPVPEAAALAAETVRSFLRTRDGRLLIGTTKGIYQRDPNRAWQPITLPDLTQKPEVCMFLEDNSGVIWLATSGLGLIRWAPDHARAYGIREGMVDDVLFSVVDDGNGALWVSSARGIARVRKTELTELDRGAVARLNCLTVGRADGLLSGASPGGGYPTAVLLADGRLMTATDKGVAVVDPRSLQVNSQPPPVVIESVVADDQPLDLTPGQAIAVPHGTNRLEVRYTALSLIAPQRLRFRYQLEGSDPRWVEAAHEHSAHYTHLAPGSYVFRVLACNNDGVWNTSGASVAIVLKPYFYQTRWFAGLVAVGLAGLAFGIYSWRTMALRWRNEQLERRIAERTAELAKSYEELKQAQTVLLETSRLAGIAEMATGVLHNLGNALNSVNTTVNLTTDRVQKSKITALGKVVQLLDEQHGRLAEFFSTDPRGQQLPGYLAHLSGHLLAERTELLHELEALQQNVDHIKQIVAAQQSYAHVSGLTETVPAAELVEYGLRISEASLHRHDVAVVREFLPAPPVKVERQKVLQILVNLIRNAKEAINAGGRPDKRLVVGVRVSAAGRVQIYVTDNGVGIAPENLTRVFAFGYTTKKAGHGFGLHSSANVAKEMGGSLVAQSDGPGQGATFVLELPSAS